MYQIKYKDRILKLLDGNLKPVDSQTEYILYKILKVEISSLLT
jgi:hypothetical protein